MLSLTGISLVLSRKDREMSTYRVRLYFTQTPGFETEHTVTTPKFLSLDVSPPLNARLSQPAASSTFPTGKQQAAVNRPTMTSSFLSWKSAPPLVSLTFVNNPLIYLIIT